MQEPSSQEGRTNDHAYNMGIAKMQADGSRVSTFVFQFCFISSWTLIIKLCAYHQLLVINLSSVSRGGRITISPTSASRTVSGQAMNVTKGNERMDIQNLREAQVRYENRKEAIINSKENLYQVRLAFVTYFNRNKITNMQIDDYVIGVKLPQIGFNFCYGLERQLFR